MGYKIIELNKYDRIYIRNDLKNRKFYGKPLWVDCMEKGCFVSVGRVWSKSKLFSILGDEYELFYSYEMIDFDMTNEWIGKNHEENRRYIVKTSEDSGLIYDKTSKCVYISDFDSLDDYRKELTESEIKNSQYPYMWKMAELVRIED